MMIPEQVRRKLAQGIGPSFGLVLMVALGYNEQLGATQPFEVALKMRYPVLFCGAPRMSAFCVLKSTAGTWYNYQTKAQYDEEKRINT